MVSFPAPKVRMFSEWEVARGHLFICGLVLPADSEAALGLLGNSVSPLQCGIGIITLELSLGNLTFQKSEEIVSLFVSRAQALKDMERCVESSRALEKEGRAREARSPSMSAGSDEDPVPARSLVLGQLRCT